MIDLYEAQEKLKISVKRKKEVRKMPVLEALGFLLAEEIRAEQSQPPFARSPFDGYALRGADTEGASREHPCGLKVVGKICAGEVYHQKLNKGEAVRIMTGAPMPEGADTVIKQEDTDYGKEIVEIYRQIQPFENYCPCGEDFQAGDRLLLEGRLLDAAAVSVLASLGYTEVLVYEKPKIAVISTGDEIVEPGTVLEYGKIYDSNRYYVAARLQELGFREIVMSHVGDDVSLMTNEIKKLLPKVDFIITIGGVSVGEKDIMHKVIASLEASKLFWKVAMQPGSPVLASGYRDKLLISLSGNPYGTVANFEALVRPVLSVLSGDENLMPKKQAAIAEMDINKKAKNVRFFRGFFERGRVRISHGNLATGALSSMLDCNCLIEMPAGTQGITKGERLWVYPL